MDYKFSKSLVAPFTESNGEGGRRPSFRSRLFEKRCKDNQGEWGKDNQDEAGRRPNHPIMTAPLRNMKRL